MRLSRRMLRANKRKIHHEGSDCRSQFLISSHKELHKKSVHIPRYGGFAVSWQTMAERLPQLNANGISGDYANEVLRLATAYQLDGWKGVAGVLRTLPCRRYEDVFPSQEYANVITAQNRDVVARINAHVLALNAMGQQEEWSLDLQKDFRRRYHAVVMLIYGHSGIWSPFDQD